MDMLSDKKCLNSLMGDSKIFTGGKRHQISYESLKKALKIYLVNVFIIAMSTYYNGRILCKVNHIIIFYRMEMVLFP